MYVCGHLLILQVNLEMLAAGTFQLTFGYIHFQAYISACRLLSVYSCKQLTCAFFGA